MQLPTAPRPEIAPHAAPPDVPSAPITLPIIAATPGVVSGGGAPHALPPVPGAPRGPTADPPTDRQTQARTGRSAGMPPPSYLPGYPDYLRGAGVAQVAALAGPGLVGILMLSAVGVLIGYRQAKAGHAVSVRKAAKFVN